MNCHLKKIAKHAFRALAHHHSLWERATAENVSLRSMAVVVAKYSGFVEPGACKIRARERAAKPREKFQLRPPQSPRGFSSLARLDYLVTKTAILRSIRKRQPRILYTVGIWTLLNSFAIPKFRVWVRCGRKTAIWKLFYLEQRNSETAGVFLCIQASRVSVSFVGRCALWDRKWAPSLEWQPYLCLLYGNIVIIWYEVPIFV